MDSTVFTARQDLHFICYVDKSGASKPWLVPLHHARTSSLHLLDSLATTGPTSLKPLAYPSSNLRNWVEFLEESKGRLHAEERLDWVKPMTVLLLSLTLWCCGLSWRWVWRLISAYSRRLIFNGSREQSSSWEAKWFSASQEIPRILRNQNIHYRIQTRPPPVPILSQLDPVHAPANPLPEDKS